MVATLITNGYHLSPERIARLNRAGLDHLQISIDNVEPDEVSLKSLRLLEPKLRWLAEHASSACPSTPWWAAGSRTPRTRSTVARRARELGFIDHVRHPPRRARPAPSRWASARWPCTAQLRALRSGGGRA